MAQANLLFVHQTDWSSRLIQIGTRCPYNHVAMVVDETRIIEALSQGVVVSPRSKYQNARIVDVGLADQDRRRAVSYALSCLGEKYDRLLIVCLALKIVTRGHLTFGIDHEAICSVLVGRALSHAGVNFPQDDDQMSPADLFRYYEK